MMAIDRDIEGVEAIDPEEDAERVPLPAELRVVYTPTGVRFHLPDPGEGLPVCDRRDAVKEVEETTVEAAREEDGRAACRKCFGETGVDDLPDEVLVAVGRQSTVYHRNGGDRVPDCGYYRGGGSDPVLVRADREHVAHRLDPCKGCFGGKRRIDACPLCGRYLGDRRGLPDHLTECPEGDEVGLE